MGGKRDRDRSISLPENNAGLDKGIDVRRHRLGIAIGSDAVGPRRIQGDEQDIRLFVPNDFFSAGQVRDKKQQANSQDDNDSHCHKELFLPEAGTHFIGDYSSSRRTDFIIILFLTSIKMLTCGDDH
jgi:hypothetical protein